MAGPKERVLPNWLDAFMKYASYSESPPHFHFWVGVSTIAGALRRRVYFSQEYYKWYPNFFIFLIAPPGVVAKSTSAALGTDLLRELDHIKFGPSAATWPALIKQMEDQKEEYQDTDGLMTPMSAVTVVCSELGTFLNVRDREMIDALVHLWDGQDGVFHKITKTGGENHLENPYINLIGCTTPGWLAENFTDYFIEGGFVSRSIFVYAEKKHKLVAYPKRNMPKEWGLQRTALSNDLAWMSLFVGEYTMTEKAYEYGEDWYARNWNEVHSHILGERYKSYIARRQAHLHKLGMVLSAAERDDLVITDVHLRTAEERLFEMENWMPKIFDNLGVDSKMSIADDIYSHLMKNGPMAERKLYREFMKKLSLEDFGNLIKALVVSEKVTKHQENDVPYYRAVPPSKS